MGRLFSSRVLFTSLVSAAMVCGLAASGCSAETSAEEDDGLGQVSEDELKSEEQSFSDFEATAPELAKAQEAAKVFDHEFTIYAIPAPKLTGLSWKSPGALARRTLINEGAGFSRAIGHVFVDIDCGKMGAREAKLRRVGQSNVGDEFRTMVLKEKAGLGVLFRTVQGVLETKEELDETLKDRYASGRIASIRYGVSGDVCHKMLDYVTEYDKRDVEKQYGFVRPLYQEGSGCSAFGISFMRLANLLEPYMEAQWRFDVNIPMSIIGGTTNPGNSVSVLRLFTMGRGWAKPGEPQIRLNGWDPTLMYTQITTQAKAALKDSSVPVEKRGKALGLILNRQSTAPSAKLANGTFFSGDPSKGNERFLTANQ